jgi:putative ABC transport system ATP-binding protein
MTEETLIRIRALKKHYPMGGTLVRALDGIDLDLPRGSFTVAMGPSGSGKSTLLYLVGGLDRPTSGSIEFNDQNLATMDENQLAAFRRQRVGFIFQSFNLVQSMNAAENVGFPMQFARVPAHQRTTRTQEALAQVQLSDRALHRPSELSGGQQQRVAIARSLVNDPQLILADEPTGNLDSASGISIMQLLSDLHHAGRTILVVTHDPRMVRFATQRIFLLDGLIVSEAAYQAATGLK